MTFSMFYVEVSQVGRKRKCKSPTSLFIHDANRHAMDEDYNFASDEAPAGLEGLEDGDGRADDADASG